MTQDQTTPRSSDDDDDEFIVPDHLLEADDADADEPVSDVTADQAPQPEHGQDDDTRGADQ